jgi:hypothetical protein
MVSVVDKIIDYTAKIEGGQPTSSRPNRPYDAWNASDAGYGVSFGLIQFNQKTGVLPLVFQAMYQRAPGKFTELFGQYASGLLDESWVRAADLNQSDLKARIVTSAAVPEFRQAQRDVARSVYFKQAEQAAAALGLKSQRAHAMLFDAFVQRSPGRVKQALQAAASGGGTEKEQLARFAVKVDEGGWTRRQNIFNDPSVSDDSMSGGTALLLGVGLLVAAVVLFWD